MGRKNKESIILNGVRIESVAAEGKAIAHVHIGDDDREGGSCGRVIFVEYAVPGDVVDILVTKKKKNYAEGRVIRIVEPSPTGRKRSAVISVCVEAANGNCFPIIFSLRQKGNRSMTSW